MTPGRGGVRIARMNVVQKLMTADQFLEWRQDQPGRWELVSGTPVQMMAGAKQRHDRIVVNLIVALSAKLPGQPLPALECGYRHAYPDGKCAPA